MSWVVRVALGLLLLLVAWLWWVLSGSVPSKATIESRLLALDANVPLREAGLQREELGDGGGDPAGELTYVHLPRDPDHPEALPADTPPVVLVHPTPDSLFGWSAMLFGAGDDGPALAGRVDVYALEIVGHGVTRTPWPESGGLQTGADWVAAALRALGLRGVCLVGQSYGGEFAWRCAVDHPELVSRLVLLDSSGYPRADGDWLPEERTMRSNALAHFGYVVNSRERVHAALQVHFRAPLADDRVEEVFQVCESADNWRAMVELVRDENGDRHRDLSRITQPTLVLWGADDLAYDVDRYGRRFAEDVPDARLVVVSDCGHYPQYERPGLVAGELLRMLGQE